MKALIQPSTKESVKSKAEQTQSYKVSFHFSKNASLSYITISASDVAAPRPPDPTVDMEPPVPLFQAPYTQ